ncbi:MAG: hypothetical protein HQK49_13015 [Oligoflexia bacterium]|nr:hypothetical protein [Oligoflexia bacterium]
MLIKKKFLFLFFLFLFLILSSNSNSSSNSDRDVDKMNDEDTREDTRPSLSIKDKFAVYRDAATIVGKKAFEIELNWRYFVTSGHYNYTGDFISLTKDETYREMDGEINGRYGVSKNFEIRSGFLYRNNASTITTSAATASDPVAASQFQNDYSIVKGSNSGPESGILGFKYGFNQNNGWNFGFDIYGRMAFYDNMELTAGSNPKLVEKIALGDSGKEISFGFDIGSSFFSKRLALSSEIFYSIPSRLSREIRYDFEAALIPKSFANNFALIAGVRGIKSLSTDEYSGTPDLKPKINTGPSYLYNSVNREYTEPFAGFNWNFSNSLQIKFRVGRVIKGYSTDQGNEYLFSLVIRRPGISEREENIKRFKEYDVEAQVVKVSPRGNFVVIDKGLTHDIEKGMKIDFYKFDYLGGNALTASGVVYQSYAETSIIKITTLYKKTNVEIGQMARATRFNN